MAVAPPYVAYSTSTEAMVPLGEWVTVFGSFRR